jgi:hypothetical protein
MKTKFHIIIKLIVVSVLLISCNGQKKEAIKPINNTIVIKELDSVYLNKIKELGKKDQKIQLIENDTVVELSDNGDTYFESRRKNNENFEDRFSYNKITHLLVATGTVFYDLPIGIHKIYNEKGELVREINYDENFSFSIYDLIEKIKITHQIDLNNSTKIKKISRIFDEALNKYAYTILYKDDENEKMKVLVVDGQTGEILNDSILIINKL